jgi:nucleoside-diphosphate-sugar epimerase
MHLLITGSHGFLGRRVVQQALERGHRVTAVVRPRASGQGSPLRPHEALQTIEADLHESEALDPALAGVDAVIHLAARKQGPLAEQMADTVEATERLLNAMDRAGVSKLVLSSSFSVYDYQRMTAWDVLDETSPEEANPTARDAYAQTKLQQERLVRDWAAGDGREAVVLRLGVIYGPGHLWTPWLGATLGARWWFRIGSRAPIPLTYVDNAATATLRAAEREQAGAQVLNVVDDTPPSQRTYSRLIQRLCNPPPRIVPVPLMLVRALASVAYGINHALLNDRFTLPSVLMPARLAARSKPMHYANARVKSALNWSPRYPLPEALERSAAPAGSALLQHAAASGDR